MSRVEEFDSFYDSTRQYVLHQVYALSGDLGIATTSVKNAYAKAWQGWSKLRTRDPLGFVRSEAWRESVLHRGPNLLRRKHSEDTDQELLDALHELPANARRLLVLQTIGELGLEEAAREVGVTELTASSATQIARAALEDRLDADGHVIARRLHDLRAVTDQVGFERPSLARRRAQRRGRRRTVAVVAASVIALIGAGVLVTQGGPLDNNADASGQRMRPVADPDQLPIADDDLLEEAQLRRFEDRPWEVTNTVDGLQHRENLSECAPQQFADPRAAGGWVRTFAPDDDSGESAVQSLEVSRNERSAAAAYRRTVEWYADCAVPRTQLMRSYEVRHADRETVVLRLRHWDDPGHTYTVGITHSGVATSTLVHSAQGKRGARVAKFARALDESLTPLCDDDKRCARPGKLEASAPPATPTAPQFLGVVDLPPIKDVDMMWVGTDPDKATPNPSATTCDNAKFKGKTVKSAQARTYVIPEEAALSSDPNSPFGISQTVGTFTNQKAAVAFMRTVIDRVNTCDDDDLTAKVTSGERITENGVTGNTWRLTFEVDDKHTVDYRLGLVRAGNRVAQVTFTPVKKYDMSSGVFDSLINRAGERLTLGSE